MSHSITLTADERATLLDYLRRSPDPALRSPAHIVLLLADGLSGSLLPAVLFCSSRTVARGQERFCHGRVPALLGQTRGAPVRLGQRWTDLVVSWIERH